MINDVPSKLQCYRKGLIDIKTNFQLIFSPTKALLLNKYFDMELLFFSSRRCAIRATMLLKGLYTPLSYLFFFHCTKKNYKSCLAKTKFCQTTTCHSSYEVMKRVNVSIFSENCSISKRFFKFTRQIQPDLTCQLYRTYFTSANLVQFFNRASRKTVLRIHFSVPKLFSFFLLAAKMPPPPIPFRKSSVEKKGRRKISSRRFAGPNVRWGGKAKQCALLFSGSRKVMKNENI